MDSESVKPVMYTTITYHFTNCGISGGKYSCVCCLSSIDANLSDHCAVEACICRTDGGVNIT